MILIKLLAILGLNDLRVILALNLHTLLYVRDKENLQTWLEDQEATFEYRRQKNK
jgi:hypothetical protein